MIVAVFGMGSQPVHAISFMPSPSQIYDQTSAEEYKKYPILLSLKEEGSVSVEDLQLKMKSFENAYFANCFFSALGRSKIQTQVVADFLKQQIRQPSRYHDGPIAMRFGVIHNPLPQSASVYLAERALFELFPNVDSLNFILDQDQMGDEVRVILNADGVSQDLIKHVFANAGVGMEVRLTRKYLILAKTWTRSMTNLKPFLLDMINRLLPTRFAPEALDAIESLADEVKIDYLPHLETTFLYRQAYQLHVLHAVQSLLKKREPLAFEIFMRGMNGVTAVTRAKALEILGDFFNGHGNRYIPAALQSTGEHALNAGPYRDRLFFAAADDTIARTYLAYKVQLELAETESCKAVVNRLRLE